MVPKKSNRITRRDAEKIVAPIRKTIAGFKSGFALLIEDDDTGRNFPAFVDWQGQLSAVHVALRGWIDCWQRFATEIDFAPLETIVARIEKSEALYFDEIDAALAVLRRQQTMLTRLPRDFIKEKTDTELIQIQVDRLGLSAQ